MKTKDAMKWQVSLRQRLSRYSSSATAVVEMAKMLTDKLNSVEPCPICYCVLHPTNHSLPDKHCSQCVGVFHSNCLSVWFRTSNSHTCPLCRQPMDY